MTRTLTALILSLVCAACSTPSGAAFGDYDPIPAGRARLYVYRPSNWRTALQRLHVTLDDRLLTRLASGGYVSVDLRPGRYHLALGFAKLFLVEWVDAEQPLSLH